MKIDMQKFPFFRSHSYGSYQEFLDSKKLSKEEAEEKNYKRTYEACLLYIADPFLPPTGFDRTPEVKGDSEKLVERIISMSYETWCGNIGYGKYIHKNEFQNYHWLVGIFIPTSKIANNYAIRFPKSISPEQVKEEGKKILLRHCNRYIKLYEAQIKNPD